MNNFRTIFFDLSEEGTRKRKEVSTAASICKFFAIGSCAITGFIGISGLMLLRHNYDLIGNFFLVTGCLSFLISIEAFQIFSNMEEIFDNKYIRLKSTLSKTIFTNELLKRTWVVGPLFGPILRRIY